MKKFTDFDLSNYNAYRIKSICKNAFFPDSVEDINILYENSLINDKVVLGNGNNIILSKEYYDMDFIIFNGNFNRTVLNGDRINAQAGTTLKDLSEFALENSLTGMEVFWDIPSSVGGAVYMNAGTNEGEIANRLVKVSFFDLAKNEKTVLKKHELAFSYRNSIFQQMDDVVILEAEFKLDYGNKEDILTRMETIRNRRWEKQPREYPNCGSVFKRPEGMFVGPMIDSLGLKGYRIGDAQVSEKHSGFIVNRGQANGSDILELIEFVRMRVKEEFGILLEIEQRII